MVATAGTVILSWLFFDTLLPAEVSVIPVTIILLRLYRKWAMRLRRRRMRQDFYQAVKVFGEDLRAGYSARNALLLSGGELRNFLPENSELLSEWQRMGRMLQNGQYVEQAFSDFSGRSGVPEIRDFSAMLSIALRMGGALSEIVDATARDLEDQEAVLTEIRTKLSARILEQRIMDLVPTAILLYIRIGSPGLLQPMYQGFSGRAIMTGCLGLYAAAVLLAERILRSGQDGEER